ncbi:hypothetical protein HNP32_001710 [Brevundimonas bullata]|uniref:Uncharacterized protein n=1 Tax=Brevundimonas bullata TaxID=13160 RepID=A0A7W7N430_9CAUL|nr:hypothetical protein [Brevundimonas bullata]MBB6382945.1 hypothetical protein [Brevundimonas bullata]
MSAKLNGQPKSLGANRVQVVVSHRRPHLMMFAPHGQAARCRTSGSSVSLAGQRGAVSRSAAFTLPFVSLSIWNARAGDGRLRPRRMREACERSQSMTLASHRSSRRLASIQVLSLVMGGKCMICTMVVKLECAYRALA